MPGPAPLFLSAVAHELPEDLKIGWALVSCNVPAGNAFDATWSNAGQIPWRLSRRCKNVSWSLLFTTDLIIVIPSYGNSTMWYDTCALRLIATFVNMPGSRFHCLRWSHNSMYNKVDAKSVATRGSFQARRWWRSGWLRVRLVQFRLRLMTFSCCMIVYTRVMSWTKTTTRPFGRRPRHYSRCPIL